MYIRVVPEINFRTGKIHASVDMVVILDGEKVLISLPIEMSPEIYGDKSPSELVEVIKDYLKSCEKSPNYDFDGDIHPLLEL